MMIIGDCCEVMQGFSADKFCAVVTSPPYNIGIKYKGEVNDNKDRVAYQRFTVRWLKQALRVAPVALVNFGAPTSQAMKLAEFMFSIAQVGVIQAHIIWVKSISIGDTTRGHFKPVNSNHYMTNLHESIFVVSRKGDYKLDKLSVGVPYADKSNIKRIGHTVDLRDRGNVVFFPYETVQKSPEHPASFPITLADYMIKLSGAKRSVLDPFAGTGTTLMAARNLGLVGVGIDLVEYQQ